MPVKVSKAMRNNELRGPTAIDTDIIPSDSEHVFAQEALYQEAMMRYHCAILEMRTKLEVLSKDMTVRYRRNPIEFIESRLKKPSSIARKLKKMGLEVTVDNMTQHLSDIAGIRVLCAYIDDIYEIARMLARQKDVRIITVKDYIKVPKDNGYRSYHLIVEIRCISATKVRPVRCEIRFARLRWTSGRRSTTICSIKSRWRTARPSCVNCGMCRRDPPDGRKDDAAARENPPN